MSSFTEISIYKIGKPFHFLLLTIGGDVINTTKFFFFKYVFIYKY